MAELPGSIDQALRGLQAKAEHWRGLPDVERAAVARACRARLATLDLSWVPDQLRCIGIDPTTADMLNSGSLEPFLVVVMTAERLDSVADRLEGKLEVPKPGRQLPESGPLIYEMGDLGQSAPGATLELWAAPEANEVPAATKGTGPGTTVVLGAGNQLFLTIVDIIECAFGGRECVFAKHHPIRPFCAPMCEHIFQPLADFGAFAQCLDTDLNGTHAALVSHPAVARLHMTGSGATHDRIVAALEASGREGVELTSELGCVSPWIVCPGVANGGAWQEAQLLHHAKLLVAAFKGSCSMNCLSPKVLVLPSETVWPQRPRFLELVSERLAAMPLPPPYYPGAHQRYEAFEKQYPEAAKIKSPGVQAECDALQEGVYPGQDLRPLASLVVDVGTIGASSCRTYALQHEAFAPVLAVATVECSAAKDFPMAAAHAVNEHLFGTLSCTVVYPDARDAALDAVISKLNYGNVAVNMFAAMGYGNSKNVWGGAPGSYSREQPQSGLGFIGNRAGVPNVMKGVVLSAFVNPGMALESGPPKVVLDALYVVISGKRFVVPRVLGVLLGGICRSLGRLIGC